MVRIARTPPPDPLTRTERSVRRNEARDAQERERDALAALTAMEQEERTVAEGSGIGRSEHTPPLFLRFRLPSSSYCRSPGSPTRCSRSLPVVSHRRFSLCASTLRSPRPKNATRPFIEKTRSSTCPLFCCRRKNRIRCRHRQRDTSSLPFGSAASLLFY
jgi:hypothetical protein